MLFSNTSKQKKDFSPTYIVTRLIIAVCVIFFAVFILRFCHKNIFIDKLQIRFEFLDEFLGMDNPGAEVLTKLKFVDVNWNSKYPFSESVTERAHEAISETTDESRKSEKSNVVTPYLSLGVKDLSIIDLRYFNGSLQTYVEQYAPDMVLVCYNPGTFAETGTINYQSHESAMDFR